MQPEELFAVFILGMCAGVLIIFLGLKQRSQQLEMMRRERIGVGGAISILGGAFIARSLLVRPDVSLASSTSSTPPGSAGRPDLNPELPVLPVVNRLPTTDR
jgi:hypothetical protein